ncbi:TetR/AcrR family transcriptional regulator [Streptantibioticus cattleyicolor]|uniref:Putative transcriptional regulator, TetR family n=1 Tax=Streptantibioticus cattleyicolor (strain ATCC 35852 / DSM 46488 / JCM 4925 / NBRC 14057 / NRRL 8057) TaxID=1003195 RepID=F8JIW0_STREN|nr:TetR/AcrR family transcriptional regulator [Streptantibioticus cattleyicolor]AEW98955.1 putative transcriptional regulator, TetR family [Streptantibioticus cattleyicolor NRRL 8057 = DSM 46488]CCB71999.1 Transcriptional regulator, TetR family (modular protein) [Streptantibioticus cattleyicolor NRRL 8057 = DSM 46488]
MSEGRHDPGRPAERTPGGKKPTLRERKKRETRQRISDVATELIVERGFDNVTVAQIAEAADVSAMTVFNHFPRKEDLFIDRIPEAIELFTGAVRDRAPDEGPLAALRRLACDLAERHHPLGAVDDDFPDFWRIVLASPALRARAREAVEELETALATAIAETTGQAPGSPAPGLVAALVVAAYRTVYLATAGRLLAGERAADLADDHRARMHAAFDALEHGLPAL